MTHRPCSVNVITLRLFFYFVKQQYVQFHFVPLSYTVNYHISSKWLIHIYQLTELHNQKERNALTALPQTLEDVRMFQAPEGRKSNQNIYYR